MTTERTLRIWRQDALRDLELLKSSNDEVFSSKKSLAIEDINRILRLTMELMDIRLMERLRGNRK